MREKKRSFCGAQLQTLRALSLRDALALLGHHVSVDPTVVPRQDPSTQRWVVSVRAQTFVLVVTGPKWFDPEAGAGGGGAIDLVMHLEGVDFVAAVKRLDAGQRQNAAGQGGRRAGA